MKSLKLKSILVEHGIKQKEFARMIGVTPVHLNYLLNGERRMSGDLMAIICDTLSSKYGVQCEPSDLN